MIKIEKDTVLSKIQDFVSYVYFLSYPYNKISISYEETIKENIIHIRAKSIGFINALAWIIRLNIPKIFVAEIKDNEPLRGCLNTICNCLDVKSIEPDYVVYLLKKKNYLKLISKLMPYGFLDKFPLELYNLVILHPQENLKNIEIKEIISNLFDNKNFSDYLNNHKLDFVIYLHDYILHLWLSQDSQTAIRLKNLVEKYINNLKTIAKNDIL
ncbi:hypothetical protein [Persephonella sp.]|uniref:hypothetical protein n=1 Tax=Persephonella sp. TaxID=2060922 RepID=UPI0026292072|nr:hypothetical protein [Persephonella sp.]